MATLSIERNAVRLERDALKSIEPPPPTKTWQPVKHYDLLTEIELALGKRDITITKEQLAVQRRGELFYGVLDLTRQTDDQFTSALGIRASNNKLMAIQIAVGARVFVCDNLMFQGDTIALKRKHTSGLNLAGEVDVAIAAFANKFDVLCKEVQAFRGHPLSDADAKALILDVYVQEHILPVRTLETVFSEYFTPQFEEFNERTVWSLYNAFTYAAKELPPERKFQSLKQLGGMFHAYCH